MEVVPDFFWDILSPFLSREYAQNGNAYPYGRTINATYRLRQICTTWKKQIEAYATLVLRLDLSSPSLPCLRECQNLHKVILSFSNSDQLYHLHTLGGFLRTIPNPQGCIIVFKWKDLEFRAFAQSLNAILQEFKAIHIYLDEVTDEIVVDEKTQVVEVEMNSQILRRFTLASDKTNLTKLRITRAIFNLERPWEEQTFFRKCRQLRELALDGFLVGPVCLSNPCLQRLELTGLNSSMEGKHLGTILRECPRLNYLKVNVQGMVEGVTDQLQLETLHFTGTMTALASICALAPRLDTLKVTSVNELDSMGPYPNICYVWIVQCHFERQQRFFRSFPNVQTLIIHSCSGIPALSNKSVTWIDIRNVQDMGFCLQNVGIDCPLLQTLSVVECQGFSQLNLNTNTLQKLKLVCYQLARVTCHSASLQHVDLNCGNMGHLDLRTMPIKYLRLRTLTSLTELQVNSAKLEVVILQHCPKVSASAIMTIVSESQNLRELTFVGDCRLTHRTQLLLQSTSVRHVCINSDILPTDEALSFMLAHCPKLESVRMTGGLLVQPSLYSASIEKVAFVHCNTMIDAGFSTWKCPKLRILELSHCGNLRCPQISAQSLEELEVLNCRHIQPEQLLRVLTRLGKGFRRAYINSLDEKNKRCVGETLVDGSAVAYDFVLNSMLCYEW